MKILIAEDDPVSRRALEATLASWGHEVVVSTDGEQALTALLRDDAPPVAILDWMMPVRDGVEVCRAVRRAPRAVPTYIILLTAKRAKDDVVRGIEAGANDYLTKPFHRDELRVRVKVGAEMARLQTALAERVKELERALEEVSQLRGILPICSYCKSIRNDENYWERVENYITQHTQAQFSHSVCPACYERIVQPQLDGLTSRK